MLIFANYGVVQGKTKMFEIRIKDQGDESIHVCERLIIMQSCLVLITNLDFHVCALLRSATPCNLLWLHSKVSNIVTLSPSSHLERSLQHHQTFREQRALKHVCDCLHISGLHWLTQSKRSLQNPSLPAGRHRTYLNSVSNTLAASELVGE